VHAKILGLRAVFMDSGKPCHANFFLHYEYRVYQFSYIDQAVEMIKLLKREHVYEDYQKKLWHQQYLERQQKAKEHATAKRLKSTSKKAA
jgi:hypothetical protein